MSMKLGYDLTIEQAQKLVMTPELIQAIQILQYTGTGCLCGRAAACQSGAGTQHDRCF